jgi:hypothetical protein
MFVGTNLLGIVVRGLKPTHVKDNQGNLFDLENTSSSSSIIMTIIFSIIILAYLYALYHFWNIGILAAGVILIVSRLPDLLFEMKTGKRLDLKNMPKRPIDKVLSILSWLALPLIWYSLCYIK